LTPQPPQGINRSGDRALNRALHLAVLSRMAHDPETKAYVARRLAEGKTKPEVRRCIKRHLARRLYRAMQALPDKT
jgi:transposase